MSLRKICVVLAMTFFALTSCTENSQLARDPKNRLEEYISKSFAITSASDKASLLEYLTGEARTRLASWSEDQFRQAFIESKRQFVKLLIREIKPVSKSEVNITYELTYLDQGKGQDAKVTNKKLCDMVLEQGKWMISGVKNIKELVEYQNEMSLP